MRFSKNAGVMTPLDEVEQVSLSASDPLPSLNALRTGAAAFVDGQEVIVRMCQDPVKQIFFSHLPAPGKPS